MNVSNEAIQIKEECNVLTLNQKKEMNRKSAKKVTIRFTEKEYQEILKDADKEGITVPKLLKQSWKTQKGKIIQLPKEELNKFTGQIMRIGNNVNTSIRKINSGEYHMIEEIKDTLLVSSAEINIVMNRIMDILCQK